MTNHLRAAKARPARTLIPALLASALLLTACGGGDTPSPTPASSSQPSGNPTATATAPAVAGGSTATGMDPELKPHFTAAYTLTADFGSDPKGPRTYEDDPAPRTTTYQEYLDMRRGVVDTFDEMAHDAEYSARNVSGFLEANPGATLADIQAETGLLVNRYENVGTMEVRQDEFTGFFFVILWVSDEDAFVPALAGALVPQEGITPEFGDDGMPVS